MVQDFFHQQYISLPQGISLIIHFIGFIGTQIPLNLSHATPVAVHSAAHGTGSQGGFQGHELVTSDDLEGRGKDLKAQQPQDEKS